MTFVDFLIVLAFIVIPVVVLVLCAQKVAHLERIKQEKRRQMLKENYTVGSVWSIENDPFALSSIAMIESLKENKDGEFWVQYKFVVNDGNKFTTFGNKMTHSLETFSRIYQYRVEQNNV